MRCVVVARREDLLAEFVAAAGQKKGDSKR